jgi:holo-[acyl-carrier protein] synthase
MSTLIGVDAVEPERIRDRLERSANLRDELFTSKEQEYCDQQAAPHLHYAARYAAKEAVVKCLAVDGFDPLEIEIVAGTPLPRVQLHGAMDAQARDLGVVVTVTLTHLESVAIAVALGQMS